MAMGDGKKIIGKVEKGFELITKARNMRLHLKGEALRDHTATDIFRSIMRVHITTDENLRSFYLSNRMTTKILHSSHRPPRKHVRTSLTMDSFTIPSGSRLASLKTKVWKISQGCGLVLH